MAAMAGIAAVASLVGTAVSVVGTIATGQAQKQAADYQAAQLDVQSKEQAAVGQRDAESYALQTKLAQSRLQAVSGADGFTSTDTTATQLGENIAGYGAEQEGIARYKGKSAAAGSAAQANAARMTGQADLTGSYFKAGGTLLSGFSSLYSNYGQDLGWKTAAAGGGRGAADAWYG